MGKLRDSYSSLLNIMLTRQLKDYKWSRFASPFMTTLGWILPLIVSETDIQRYHGALAVDESLLVKPLPDGTASQTR